MTDQEAIKWIDGRIQELVKSRLQASSPKEVACLNEEYKALLLARAALEKQIPKAPALKIDNNDELWRKERYICVKCGAVLYIQNHIASPDGRGFRRFPNGSRSATCPKCGQAIAWGETAHV